MNLHSENFACHCVANLKVFQVGHGHSGFEFNFSELHHEKLCEKNLLVLMSHKGPQWLGIRDRIF